MCDTNSLTNSKRQRERKNRGKETKMETKRKRKRERILSYASFGTLENEAGNHGVPTWDPNSVTCFLIWSGNSQPSGTQGYRCFTFSRVPSGPLYLRPHSYKEYILLEGGREDSLQLGCHRTAIPSLHPCGLQSFLCFTLVMGAVRKEKSIL